MWYLRGAIIEELKKYNIVVNGELNKKFNHLLLKYCPRLIQIINAATVFLEYPADIKTRIHCILKGVREQPTCGTCGRPTKMRLTGRERYTFPEFCSSSCAAKNNKIIDKRRKTCIERYGVSNVLTRQSPISTLSKENTS